jgi:hypothetical protein
LDFAWCKWVFDLGFGNFERPQYDILSALAPKAFNLQMYGCSVGNLALLGDGGIDVVLEFDDVMWDNADGYHLMATWQTIVGEIEEVLGIPEVDSMPAYHEGLASLLGCEEWKVKGTKLIAICNAIKSRFLRVAPLLKD